MIERMGRRMTEQEAKILNDYLAECIKNSHHCAHCIYNYNNICFFAGECIKNDYKFYTEEDEE